MRSTFVFAILFSLTCCKKESEQVKIESIKQVGYWTLVPKGNPSDSFHIDLYTSIKYNIKDSLNIKLTSVPVLDRNGDTVMQNALARGLVSDSPLVFPIRSNEIFSAYWVDSLGTRKRVVHQYPTGNIIDTIGDF